MINEFFRCNINLKGIDVLKDEVLFMAMFSDLAPQLVLENKIIKRICTEKGLSRFYNLVASRDSEKKASIEAVIVYLKNDIGFSDEWIQIVIKAFCDAFNISYKFEAVVYSTPNPTSTVTVNTNIQINRNNNPSVQVNPPKPSKGIGKVIVPVACLVILIGAVIAFNNANSSKNDSNVNTSCQTAHCGRC